MSERKDGGLKVGKMFTEMVPALNADRLVCWQAQMTCLQCGRPVTVWRGDPAVVEKIGNEVLGIVGPCCLTDEGRERLAELRDGGGDGDEAVLS